MPANPDRFGRDRNAEHAASDVVRARDRHGRHSRARRRFAPFDSTLASSCFRLSPKIIDLVVKLVPLRGRLPAVHQHGPLRIRSACRARVVRVHRSARLGLHMFGVYSLSIVLSFRAFRRGSFSADQDRDPHGVFDLFIECDSATALRVSEENLGVPQEINSFVLTVGATANQNGTALYEGVTVLFLAQLAGSISRSGTADGGLSRDTRRDRDGGRSIGVDSVHHRRARNDRRESRADRHHPGVDRFLDMCRTTFNVTGDLTAATYVARSEGYSLLETEIR